MYPVNFRSYRKKLSHYRKSFRSFLNGTEKNPPRGIDMLSPVVEKEVWQEVDCLSCANCCKKMTPTFTTQDIKRIASHFNQTPEAFRKQ